MIAALFESSKNSYTKGRWSGLRRL